VAGLERTVRIVIQYKPRDAFRPFHASPARFSCLVCHRRAGKTVACVNRLIRSALKCKHQDPRVAYVAPYYVQAKDIAWTYAKRFSAPIPGVQFNESELRVDYPNGGRLRLYGADNPDRLRGGYLDDVVLDEYADMMPSLWGEIIRPMLADRKGSAAFIGTPKGRNEFFSVWERAKGDPSWFAMMLRASESGLLAPEEIAAARAEMTPEQFEQEFECSFTAAILGAYYGREMAEAERTGRIASVGYDPSLPVHTAWDLGMGDSTSIWLFQVAANELRVIDFIESHGQPLAYYVGELQARGYRYGDDWVPHDAKVRSLETGRTRVETLVGLGRSVRVVPDHRLDDGINGARVSFPRMWFDADKCRFGLEALRQYRTEYDEKTKAYKNVPKHDWTSHAADAFRYMAMAWKTLTPPTKPKDAIAELLKPRTWGEIFANEDDAVDG
jgi:phage terminase large subunit